MGPDRHRNWINALSVAVALNIVVALVTVFVRGDGADSARQRVAAGVVEAPSPLAAGTFTNRRTAPVSPSTAAVASSTTTAAPTTSSTAAPRPTTSRPATVAAPVTTTTRRVRVRQNPPTGTAATPATRARSSAPSNPSNPASPSAPASPSGPAPASAAVAPEAPTGLSDPVGDTFVANTDAPISEPRADIVSAGAVYEAGAIRFGLQVAQPTDPLSDKGWTSKRTTPLWSIDTNGDTIADYDIHYVLAKGDDTEGSALFGYVTRPGERKSLCPASAAYGADGYQITVDPGCFENPASFTFRASMSYEADQKAGVASDIAPDTGFSPPVRK